MPWGKSIAKESHKGFYILQQKHRMIRDLRFLNEVMCGHKFGLVFAQATRCVLQFVFVRFMEAKIPLYVVERWNRMNYP